MTSKLKFEDIKVGDELVDSSNNKHVILYKGERFILTDCTNNAYIFGKENIFSKSLEDDINLVDYYKPELELKVGAYGVCDFENCTCVIDITEKITDPKSYISFDSGNNRKRFSDKLKIWSELAMQEGAREFDLHKKNYYMHCNFDNVIGAGLDNDHRYLQVYFDTDKQVRQAISNIGEEKLKILFGV